ncbi:IS4 family transposase [Tunicatimonas pelagia]|uniref:IS4 family transposase n=1 Tax=Tunicatimonas pelagia TaxID=931531 RepID=UPI0026662F3A|nr:IS4 family transposase [Tunicatimonas pelagia]WKN40872.1 IS4 family transposase [Tunicatimonas pelagia]
MLGDAHLSGNAFRRLSVLAAMVSGVLQQGSSRLTDLGRANPDLKQQASKEKQYKRWIINEHTSYSVHYLPYLKALLKTLSAQGCLVFSIDGSAAGRGCMVLMISVIYRQRATPVVWTVVWAKKGHLPEKMHRQLLERLAEIVPSDCQISIVGDGEYDGCNWQADIIGYGWNYVLRTGCAKLAGQCPQDMLALKWLAPAVGQTTFTLTDAYFTHQHYGPLNITVWHEGKYKEAIYLLSNLDYPPLITQLYKKRFKPGRRAIETFFSDQKSRGFNLQRSHLNDPERLAKLLIATCLAYIFCILAGVQCQQSQYYPMVHRTDRCDLSLFFLGRRFLELFPDLREWLDLSLQTFAEQHHE